jgi:hypothetical protein
MVGTINTSIKRLETEGATFRLRKIALDKLRNDAIQKQISLNTLANQIFEQYLDYNANAAKAGIIGFPKVLLIKLIDNLSEEEIVQIAQNIATTQVKDMVFLLKGKYTIESFLAVVESWIRASGFPFKHEINGTRHLYIIQHDLNKKWSLYLSKLFEFVMEDLIERRPIFQISNNSIVFEVDTEKHDWISYS